MKTLLELQTEATRGTLPLDKVQEIREAIGVLATVTAEAETRSQTNAEAVEKVTRAAADLKDEVDSSKEALVANTAKLEEIRTLMAVNPSHATGINARALSGLPILMTAPPEFRSQGLDDARTTLLFAPISQLALVVPDEGTLNAISAYRRLNDLCVTYDAMVREELKGNHAKLEEYQRVGGVRSCPLYRAFEPLNRAFYEATAQTRANNAVSTSAAGEGLEWMPTLWGSADIRVIQPELSIGSYFETTTMTSNPMKNAITGFLNKSVVVAESLTPGQNAIPYQQFVTQNMTWTALTHSGLLAFSLQAQLSSILPLLSEVLSRLTFAIEWGKSDAFTNGQKSSTFDTNAAIPAGDPRTLWDGFRWCAQQTQIKKNASAGLTVKLFTDLVGLSGRFGRNPAMRLWETGYMGYAKLLNLKDDAGNAVVLTQDKVGPGAAIRTGVFGQLLGSSIHVDDDFPADMDANGVRVAGGSKTGFLMIHKPYVRPANFMGAQIMASDHVLFLSNQKAVKINSMDALSYTEAPSQTVPFVTRIDDVEIAVTD